jgi:hypothetical protein
MPTVTHCPSCGHALRIGDDLTTRNARCPMCKTVFPVRRDGPAPAVAPLHAALAEPTDEEALPRPTRPDLFDDDTGRPADLAAARRRVGLPGLGLVLVGLVNTLAYGAALGFVLLLALGKATPPDPLKKWNDERIEHQSPGVTYLAVNEFKDGTAIQLTVLAIGLVLGLCIIIGGFQMRGLRGFLNVLMSSVVALVLPPGLVLGLPIGLWALVVLMNRNVREAFA